MDNRTYDTFGKLISQTGSSTGKLGFQSKYFDQESGLNYYFHRYYYPKIGRFINEDPIGLTGGLNMYRFLKNNSINYIDPYAFFCISFDLGGKINQTPTYNEYPKVYNVTPSIKNPYNPYKITCWWKLFGYVDYWQKKTEIFLCWDEDECGHLKGLPYIKIGETRTVYDRRNKVLIDKGKSEGIAWVDPNYPDKVSNWSCNSPWFPYETIIGRFQ